MFTCGPSVHLRNPKRTQVWSESERAEGEEEAHDAGDRWMRRRGRRHWRDVRGVVLKGQLFSDKRLCAIWLDELIQVRGSFLPHPPGLPCPD